MQILSFQLKGKFAHFRKYYANNTAFTFSIPPRTTLMGIVAAAMGWKKDSYYEKLSPDHIHFGIRVCSPVKKSFQRLNFLSIKSLGNVQKSFNSDFRGQNGWIQTPFEVLTSPQVAKGNVNYQVFIASNRKNESFFQNIAHHFMTKEPVYNLSLGPANFQASLSNIELIENSAITHKESDNYVNIHSAVPTSMVEELSFEKDQPQKYNFVEEELLPGSFIENNQRELESMNRLLFSTTNQPLRVRLNQPYLNIGVGGEKINIQFMDI